MRLSQMRTPDGARRVAAVLDDGSAVLVPGFERVYDLALRAIAEGRSLADMVAAALAAGPATPADLEDAGRDGRLLVPLDHPEPAHTFVTGTGFTHPGSTPPGRDAAPADGEAGRAIRTPPEGGRRAARRAGPQPEWFYKGDGTTIVAPGAALPSPAFALDGGEEPEIVGLYVIGPDGTPWRAGFALGNEFSDHVSEGRNPISPGHAKLRPASFGPEILVGPLPPSVSGISRIVRGGSVVWQRPFLTGEDNMCRAIADLEHHHFKHPMFRRPGDVHVHFFGAATLSYSDGVATRPGDVFEISAPPFGLPLRNTYAVVNAGAAEVRAL